MPWYEIENIGEIDSPSLVLYKDHLIHNLKTMLSMVNGDAQRLMPHIKTNKMPEVIKLMISLGIENFKASTIAEAEIAASVGAKSVLIAHQLVGPKITRFGELIKTFPKTQFSTIIDNSVSLQSLNEVSIINDIHTGFYIDINGGMNRSGIEIGANLNELLSQIIKWRNLKFNGLHVYDGHIRETDFNERKRNVEKDFSSISDLYQNLKSKYPNLRLICGGTPTFTAHLSEENRITSPGTCVFWDWGYDEKLLEQEFKFAVLLITRVISKPTRGIVTIDLGHKSVAPENTIDKRIKFLNLADYELLSQSEEHGVLQVKNWEAIAIGDVLYGIPYHICPTVNLHNYVTVINNVTALNRWDINRNR